MSIEYRIPMECGQLATMIIDKYSDTELDIAIGNSSHFGGNIINEAWVRLDRLRLKSFMSDIKRYLDDTPFTQKRYSIPTKFGYSNHLSVEVSHYTNNQLEIHIGNESTFNGGIVSETFIRLTKRTAELLYNELQEFLGE